MNALGPIIVVTASVFCILFAPLGLQANEVLNRLKAGAPYADISCGVSGWSTDALGFEKPAYKKCHDLLQLITEPAPPRYRENGDWEDWGAEYHSSDLADKLRLYFLAEFQSLATLYRSLRKDVVEHIVYEISLKEQVDCNKYYKSPFERPRLSSIEGNGNYFYLPPGKKYAPYRETELKCHNLINRKLNESFHDLDSVKNTRSLLKLLIEDTQKTESSHAIGVVLLAIQTLRTDFKVDDIVELLNGGTYYPLHQSFGSQPNLENVDYELLEAFGDNQNRTAKPDTETAVVIADNLSFLPAITKPTQSNISLQNDNGTARSFSSKVFISNTIKLNGQHYRAEGARSNIPSRRNGQNIVVASNQITLGNEEQSDTSKFESLISYPLYAVLNRRGQTPYSSDDPDSVGSGSFVLVSPQIRLAPAEIARLRRTATHFQSLIAPDGFDKFVLRADERKFLMRGFTEENPYAATIRSATEMSLQAFLPVWEAALTWQMENDPINLHRYIYTDGDDVISGDRNPMLLPLGSGVGEVVVSKTFNSHAIPRYSLDRWKIRYLQELEAELNSARVSDDVPAMIDVFKRLAVVTQSAMTTTTSYADQINKKVAELLAHRQHLKDRVVVSALDIKIEGEPESQILSFADGDTLLTKLAPTKAMFRPQHVDGQRYAGILETINSGEGPRLRITADIDLATDATAQAAASESIRTLGQKISSGFPNWKLTPRPLVWSGILSSSLTQVSPSRIHVEVVMNPSLSGSFFSALASQSGIPLVIDWDIVKDSSANSGVAGPLSLNLSLQNRSSTAIVVEDGSFVNKDSDPYIIDYVCLQPSRCLALNVPMLIPAKGRVPLPLAISALAEIVTVPTTGVRVNISGGDWFSPFRYTDNAIARSFRLSNLIGSDNKFGGIHKNVQIVASCVRSNGDAINLLDAIEMQQGEIRLLTCLRPHGDDVRLKIRGSAFFENGGRAELLERSYAAGSVTIDRSSYK